MSTRIISPRTFIVVLSIILLFTLHLHALDFYVLDVSGTPRLIKGGDPDRLEVEEWQVWLYKIGTPPGVGRPCGMITGSSVSHVMAQLERDQTFDRAWYASIGAQPSYGVCTSYEFLGPVARLRSSRPSAQKFKLPQSLKDVYERLQDARRCWSVVNAMARSERGGASGGAVRPLRRVGSVLSEYTRALREATSLWHRLAEEVLNGADMRALDSLVGELNDALEQLRSTHDLAKQEIPDLDAAGRGHAATTENCQPGSRWDPMTKNCVCSPGILDRASGRCVSGLVVEAHQ